MQRDLWSSFELIVELQLSSQHVAIKLLIGGCAGRIDGAGIGAVGHGILCD